jgi:hypothetical protein
MPRKQAWLISEYRRYSLTASRGLLQWSVEIAPLAADMPVLPLEMRVVRGWEGDDLLSQAKTRVDHLLASHPPLYGPNRWGVRFG